MDLCWTRVFLVFLLRFSLSGASKFSPKTFHFVPLERNWPQAQQYCTDHYTELATYSNVDDINNLPPRTVNAAWIGLTDRVASWKTLNNDSNSWKWSMTSDHSTTHYTNWLSNEPNAGAAERYCVALNPTGMWADYACTDLKSYICVDVSGPNQTSFVFYQERKAWTSAQEHCRKHHKDLATLENSEDNAKVTALISSEAVAWIGLYRVRWMWVDGSPNSFIKWRKGEFSKSKGVQFCATIDVENLANDLNCIVLAPFICQQVHRLTTLVRLKFQTNADFTVIDHQLLQQIRIRFESLGWKQFNLTWKIKPNKRRRDEAGFV